MAGTKYNLPPDYQPQEFYRVDTGVRKSGPWKLDITNLVVGSTLPVCTPVQADLKKRTLIVVRNVKVIEKYTTGASMKIAKDSLAYVGMFIGDGAKGAEISVIDKTSKNHDVLTLKAELGATVEKDAVLFEATAVGGSKKKNTANFVLFEPKKVESDSPVLCTLLMQAYEVKEPKLILPIHDLDKKELTDRFQFEY